MNRPLLLMLLGTLLAVPPLKAEGRPVVFASKKFAESEILGELMAQLVEAHTDLEVTRKHRLAGTKLAFDALVAGEIDAYAEYTGTALLTILKEEDQGDPLRSFAYVRKELLSRYGIELLSPFGFNNTYALCMREQRAEELGIKTISDLGARVDAIQIGLSHEFLNRPDGWIGLAEAYGLGEAKVRGIEHGLAYAAIESGDLDVVDAYSTDGKLARYRLRVLEDDRSFFPHYHAAPMVRSELLAEHPELRPLLERLALRLSAERMQRLNLQVEVERLTPHDVARNFLIEEGLLEGEPSFSEREGGFLSLFVARGPETLALAWQHMQLTLLAVLLAVGVSVPLAILCTRVPGLAQPVLGGAGVIQTIPSLALLAFMIPIPFLGLGTASAVVALFLYAILPIVRNTYTGICEVDPDLVEAARGMGLTNSQILRFVQLPIATRTIMAGVRTSTVISVGVATLAAFIGAGGLGEPILTGLQLNDQNLILCGAIPAAVLAIVVDQLLGILERVLVPNGLQLSK